MATTKKNSGKGRPSIEIKLPTPHNKQFTILDVVELNNDACCELTVRKFIKTAIADSRLVIVGNQKTGGKGRPRLVLQRA